MGDLTVELKAASPLDRAECCKTIVDEHSLAIRIANGDQAAFAELIDLHGDEVARLIGRLIAWHDDCDDILQDVFLTVWQQAGSFNGSGSLEGWLKRIAVNRCRNHFRMLAGVRRKLERFANRVLMNSNQQYESSFETVESSPALHAALQRLSTADRMILVLYYLEEIPGNEVAHWLNIQPGAFHVRLHRARTKLKKSLIEGENSE